MEPASWEGSCAWQRHYHLSSTGSVLGYVASQNAAINLDATLWACLGSPDLETTQHLQNDNRVTPISNSSLWHCQMKLATYVEDHS